jgi:ribosomal subunit interface protein
MTLRVSGKNLDIGEALRVYVEQRINAMAVKYFDGGITGHVTLEPEGSGYRTDCALHLSSGITLHAEARAQEPYASFDQAAGRIEKRLRRYKGRLKSHHPAGNGSASESGGQTLANYVIAPPDAEAEEIVDFNPVVIAETTGRLRDLSVSAAVMDLDLTGAPVIVFRHAGNGRVNIVYRRLDGHIGWVDPAGPLSGVRTENADS